MLAEARMAREAAEQAMREAEEARKADDGLVTQDAYVHIVSTRKRVRDYECDGCTSLVVSGRPVLTSGGKHVTGSHDLIGEKMAKRAAEAKFQRAMVECFPDFGRWLASGNGTGPAVEEDEAEEWEPAADEACSGLEPIAYEADPEEDDED